MMLSNGTPAPAFALPDQNGVVHSLSDERGRWVLVYFYPKDDTPGCTTEACNFRDHFEILQRKGVTVFGVSKDPVESHRKFAEKFQLPFALLADPDRTMIEAYGAWGEKTFLGKTSMGILRTSYLIDPDGNIARVYGKVKPEEHAKEVLQDLEKLA